MYIYTHKICFLLKAVFNNQITKFLKILQLEPSPSIPAYNCTLLQ